jgi:type IV secretion system protein TrbL
MNPTALNTIIDTFQGHGAGWGAALLPYALTLFAGLAAIQFTLRVGFAVAQRVDLPELLALVVQEILTIGFFYWFLQNAATFLKAIVDSFRQIANAASVATGGSQNMSPVDVFSAGVNMAKAIWAGLSWGQPLLGGLLIIAGVICAIVFALVAAMMIEVLIESILVSYSGVLMCGFGGSAYTREFAIGQIRYAISVGAKLFIMQMLIGVSEAIIRQWSVAISAGEMVTEWGTVATMIGVPIVILRLVQKLPQMGQNMVNGSVGHTHGGLFQTAAAVGAAAVGTAAAASGAGVAAVESFKLAGRQMQQQGGGGGGTQSRIAQAALMPARTVGNVASAAASDVGRRLTGQSLGRGHMGWRMAADLSSRKK